MKWNERVETWQPWGVCVVDDYKTMFFLSVWMEKQKTEKLMEVQLPMEYVFGSLGVYWIKKKIKWGVCVVDDYETMFFKCLDGKTKTGKINGGVAGYGVCVW